jgi:hypothetical protein
LDFRRAASHRCWLACNNAAGNVVPSAVIVSISPEETGVVDMKLAEVA